MCSPNNLKRKREKPNLPYVQFSVLEMYSVRNILTMYTRTLVRIRSTHGVQNFMSTKSQLAKDREWLYDVLPSVVNSSVKNPKFSEISEMSSFLQKLMEYNLTGGKKSRGLAVVSAYETIEKPENITAETLKKARTLAWILEINHAHFIIGDDIMDGSTTRRGKPCWHELPDVGIRALNDCELLKFSVYECFHTHFNKAPFYNEMLDIYNETFLYSTIGAHLDYTMTHRIKSDYSLFTIERYNSIVKYKTAYYTFKLPILLGYLLANNSDKNLHKKVEDVCLALGRLSQIQDDMLDCYGDESVTGKKGTDIQEGRCTWFAVHALNHSNDAQRAFFIENYADKDPSKVQNIKHLFEELKLQNLYNIEEKVLYERIKKNANALPANDRKLMLKLLNMYYKRNM